VIELGETAQAPSNAPPPAPDFPARPAQPDAVPALLSQIETLQARIHALEEAAPRPEASPQVTPPAEQSNASLPEISTDADAPHAATGKLQWISHSTDAPLADAFPPKLEKALLHNLKAFPGRAITIKSALGDETAHAHADRLKQIFEHARWTVRGPIDAPLPRVRRGLLLTVGTLPASRNAAAAYFALTASGFTLFSVLDSEVADADAVLVVT
jgi:hypothetical protein